MESWGKSVVSTTGTASAKTVRQGRPQLFQEYKGGHYSSSRVTRMCWETWLVVVVQSPSHVQLFATPRTAARQASLFLTISQSLPKFMSIASVMSSSHLILLMPFSPAFNLSRHQGLYMRVSYSHQVSKKLELQFQCQSFE